MCVGVRAQQKQQQHFAWLCVFNTLFVLTRMDLCCSFQAHTRKKETQWEWKKNASASFFLSNENQSRKAHDLRTRRQCFVSSLLFMILFIFVSIVRPACLFCFYTSFQKASRSVITKVSSWIPWFFRYLFSFWICITIYTFNFFYLSFVNTFIERSSRFFFSVCYLLNV